jgi:putative cytotoxic protein
LVYSVVQQPVRPARQSYVMPPDTLPGFPAARKVRPKTLFAGGKKRRRWRDSATGVLYEWDYQHGRVEAYDGSGRHLGEFDPVTGAQLKPAEPGHRIEP